MDWNALRTGLPADTDLPPRSSEIQMLLRVLRGTQYDHLEHDFSEEKSAGGDYIPLKRRRPSVRTNLCRTVVDDTVSLLFGDNHFPTILSGDETTRAALSELATERALDNLMMETATLGSVGSVVIRLRVLKNRPFYDALTTEFLTPAWREDDPEELERVTESYKVASSVLKDRGYDVDASAGDYWFQRVWDDAEETWFVPWPVSKREHTPVRDDRRSLKHGLGFVPLLWVRNLPGGDVVDGVSTFARAISIVTELDYLLSQGGRGLKYSSDPTLVLRTASDDAPGHQGGSAMALVVPPEGDAKLLEINGSASGALLKFAQELRTQALEQMHGNRAHPDKMTAAQSGRAMEMLNQGLVWLASKLRASYGTGALLSLLKMTCRASQEVKGGLKINGKAVVMDPAGLTLKWPDWYPPTADDRMAEVNALGAAITHGVLSRETAVQTAMEFYDVPDLAAEMGRIKQDMAEADARLAKQAAQTQAKETVES